MARSSKTTVPQARQAYLGLGPAFVNKGLFADNYLENRLQQEPQWQGTEGVEEAFQAIQKLYRQKADHFTAKTNEAQTEHDFIKPILDLLWREPAGGDCYQVQVRIPHPDLQRQPDYAFFRSAAEREAAQPRIGLPDYWRDVACLGDAKKWSASLDKERGADENPTAQICNYLYRSRVRWGILTNGRVWRLYERERSSAGGIYYEVDLENLLRLGDRNVFKYFFLFFRRLAFVPDAGGVTFVEKVFQGSVDYAAQVGNRLKESVYDALRFLMNGFLSHKSNALDAQEPATLPIVHENALIVLYRLLFLLYAEDRNLLPRAKEPYASNSLYRLQREINDHLRSATPYPPFGHRIWNELTGLFELIDKGFPEGGIPAYNGGLFSPANYPHVAYTSQPGQPRWEIGDNYLAQAIDLLAYERERWDEPGSQDVDYATLAVQHLGSIYEGLLELEPHVATEALIETLEDGKPVFKPAREVANPRPVRGQPPRTVGNGEVYLVTNRGERKATGSYYTPKYIVDYIVEHTVGPLASAAAATVTTLAATVLDEVTPLKKNLRQWEKQLKNGNGPLANREIAKLNREIDAARHRLLEPYLELKILDPAMGSGHFLVGAADFLSLAMANDPRLPDAPAGEDPQAYYKRLVVERCLYGVDLNPLAVELAKLSLWLHTVSRNKALSFLDHHLRCGNSLIGARIEEDLEREPPQFNARGRRTNADAGPLFPNPEAILTLAHLQGLLDAFRQIVDLPSGDAAGEREKANVYEVMDKEREKYRSLANSWLAPYFGVSVTAGEYQQAVNAVRASGAAWDGIQQEAWFEAAQRVAREKRFFHWELEFPEIFFGRQGLKPQDNRGFDAVIGNPPYGMTTDPNVKNLVGWHYKSAEGRDDVYKLFTERSFVFTRRWGLLSFITSNTVLSNRFDAKLRRLLLTSGTWKVLVTFGYPVFEDPTVHSAVFVIQRESAPPHHQLKILAAIPSPSRLAETGREIDQEGFLADQFHLISIVQDSHVDTIRARINDAGQPLGQLAHIRQCIKTGKDAEYLRVSMRPLPEPWKAVLGGSDVTRYCIDFPNRYLNYGPWLARNWQNPGFFERPKIIVRETSERITGALDTKHHYLLSTLYSIYFKDDFTGSESLQYLLAVLNTQLAQFYMHHLVFTLSAGAFIKARTNHYARFPIRRIAFTTAPDKRGREFATGKQLYEDCLNSQEHTALLTHVENQLTDTPEQADVVHDLLAFLAEQMISLNRQKQEEVGGFLTWLARKISAAVDDLANKTRLRAYHDHDFNGLLDVLRQNRRKLKIDPDSRAVQEAVERELGKSLETLTPLKARITATDRLIDQIVYRLYGLKAAEIAIVEGK